MSFYLLSARSKPEGLPVPQPRNSRMSTGRFCGYSRCYSPRRKGFWLRVAESHGCLTTEGYGSSETSLSLHPRCQLFFSGRRRFLFSRSCPSRPQSLFSSHSFYPNHRVVERHYSKSAFPKSWQVSKHHSLMKNDAGFSFVSRPCVELFRLYPCRPKPFCVLLHRFEKVSAFFSGRKVDDARCKHWKVVKLYHNFHIIALPISIVVNVIITNKYVIFISGGKNAIDRQVHCSLAIWSIA